MYFQYLILACFVSGWVMCLEDSPRQIINCNRLFPKEMKSIEDGFPDADLLPVICPQLIAFFECEEQNVPSAEEDPLLRNFFEGSRGIVNEICEDDSRLQKDYLASVECFNNIPAMTESCYSTSLNLYLSYREFITREGGSDEGLEGQITSNEPRCLIQSYASACISIDILEKCGQLQHDTFLEVVRRAHFLPVLCTDEESKRHKVQYLDFLTNEKDHPQMEVFSSVFDFRRK